MYNIITLTGDLGSGKSTISKMLSDFLNWEIITIGSIQRELAQEMNMDTVQFNRYMQEHPEIDEEIDERIKELSLKQNLIVDSRLAWYWLPNSLKIQLTVNIEEAAKRIYEDSKRKSESYTTIEAAKEKILERYSIEVARLKELYGVDITNKDNYDVSIDTTHLKKEDVFNLIVKKLKSSF